MQKTKLQRFFGKIKEFFVGREKTEYDHIIWKVGLLFCHGVHPNKVGNFWTKCQVCKSMKGKICEWCWKLTDKELIEKQRRISSDPDSRFICDCNIKTP